MPGLFEVVPDKLFSVLSSANKELYVLVLFVIRDAFELDLRIKRSELMMSIRTRLEEKLANSFLEEEEAEYGRAGDLQEKANLILRRLKETGWIDTEDSSDTFEVYITLPEYSVEIINLLYELSNSMQKEYSGYVYATYASFKTTEENPDYSYEALKIAYEKTEEFIKELKILYNSIKSYMQKIADKDVNELLSQHFDSYGENIMKKILDPLKTTDSVPRFKNRILDYCYRWLSDEDKMNSIIEKGMLRESREDRENVMLETYDRLNFIIDTYQSVEQTIREIENRHNQYTKTSLERIRYRMNSDNSAKGNVIDLLSLSENPEVLDNMEAIVEISPFQFIDSNLLYDRVEKISFEKLETAALQIKKFDKSIEKDFLNQSFFLYSYDKVDSFVLDNLKDREYIETEDFSISVDSDFILYLESTLRGLEDAAPFTYKFLDGVVSVGGYTLARARYERRQLC